MSDGFWEVEIAPRARRDLRNLDRQTQERVLAAIHSLADDVSLRGIAKLKDRAESRLRVGDWRVLMLIDAERSVLVLTRIVHRREAYR